MWWSELRREEKGAKSMRTQGGAKSEQKSPELVLMPQREAPVHSSCEAQTYFQHPVQSQSRERLWETLSQKKKKNHKIGLV
jgi:hypothetical protein